MAVVALAEKFAWYCACSTSAQEECPHIRARLSEIGCNDAAVHRGVGVYGDPKRVFVISRALLDGAASCKLLALSPDSAECRRVTGWPSPLAQWQLALCYRSAAQPIDRPPLAQRSVYLRDLGGMDADTAPAAAAFALLFFTAPYAKFTVENIRTYVSDIVRAAETYGLTYRDVLFSSRYSGNLLHVWASWQSQYIDGVEVMRAVLTDIQTEAERAGLDVYRRMLAERNDAGLTPYDLAVQWGHTPEIARLFQLTGPKSAAGAE